MNHKKIVLQFSYIYSLWFYQDFESENLCFSILYAVHAARIPDLSLEILVFPKEEQSTFMTINVGTGIIFLFFRCQIHHCF